MKMKIITLIKMKMILGERKATKTSQMTRCYVLAMNRFLHAEKA